ncbi:probable inactive peptidyl-prolyl cis-trans isomerase-like 6 isoform X2 [Ovis aries]|uniref:probable inactive peptidyl-prolyl cis-trans isomerase-like 6 isoform X2 n=1 Tax=Ovis aries TaxID=9940 RepID=UPI0029527476|nr:probable inactive peptidyl-prolyl cis-trans isomerase-like 6 isoform X2 [Ovis aries]
MASQQQSVPCISRSPPEQPLQVKVVGLFKSSSFQIAKSAAEELKNEVWEYSSYVMCFINDKLLGDALDLQKWAHKIWDIVDFKPPALYEALTVDYSAKFLRDTKHNFVFLDISIDLYPIGRLIFELYSDTCPKTCKNFQILCTGKAGFSQSGIKLHYAGSIFHRVVRNGWVQGGDIVAGKGDNGESIYGPTFEVLPLMRACVLSLQPCPTLCDPVDCSLPGSLVHGILQSLIHKSLNKKIKFFLFWTLYEVDLGFPCGSDSKELGCNAGDPGLIPGVQGGGVRSPREGNGYPLQDSCLENSMDRGAQGLQSMGSQRVRHA